MTTFYTVQLITPRIGAGLPGDEYGPQFANDYPSLISWRDVTAQPTEQMPTEPNLLIIEAILTGPTLDELEADPTYQILWSFENPES